MPEDHDHSKSGAPGDLELVRRFVNTNDFETGAEDLSGPAELAAWLEEMGLAEAAEVSTRDVPRAIEAREALRSLLLENNGAPAAKGAWQRLDAAFSGAASEVRFEDGTATLVPRGGSVDAALARLAIIVRDAMASGEWSRLKACSDDECQWAFYDRSRNRSRTWCDMQDCGNRAKVLAFRARKSR